MMRQVLLIFASKCWNMCVEIFPVRMIRCLSSTGVSWSLSQLEHLTRRKWFASLSGQARCRRRILVAPPAITTSSTIPSKSVCSTSLVVVVFRVWRYSVASLQHCLNPCHNASALYLIYGTIEMCYGRWNVLWSMDWWIHRSIERVRN